MLSASQSTKRENERELYTECALPRICGSPQPLPPSQFEVADKPDRRRMGRPILNKTQQAYAEGNKNRQATLDALLDVLTGPSIPSDQLRESAFALVMFEGKLAAEIDRVSRSFDANAPKEREVRRTLLLGVALRALNALVK
jgi:hypothetical protein